METTFFERLERLMFERRIGTQKKLAELTGIDNGTISRWKRDAVTPHNESLKKLSEILGCPVEYLKDGSMPVTINSHQRDRISGSIGTLIQSHDNQNSGGVTVNHNVPAATIPEMSQREQALILRMRRFAPQAMWEQIEADLDELEKRFR